MKVKTINLKVSIITVCYNAQIFIEKAIQSVLSQTYENIEHIIIDGQSTDDTLKIVNQYKEKISKIISEKDQGIYDAMNKGIRLSSGDILFFLNSDDRLYDSTVIADVVNAFIKDDQIGIIYGKLAPVDVPKEFLLRAKNRSERAYKKKSDIWQYGLSHQRFFAKKWIFNKFGCFDTNYKVSADLFWFLVAYNNGVKLKYIDRFVVNLYYQGFSYHMKERGTKEKIKIIYKTYSFPEFLYYFIFASIRTIYRFACYRLGIMSP